MPMSNDKASAIAEWKSGWSLVLAASVGFSFFSIMLAATGIFMKPLQAEFGWNRTLLSAGPSIATVGTAILAPFYGLLIDWFGARRVVLPGLVLTIAAICAFSLADGTRTQWLALWVAFGLVAGSIKSTAWTSAVLGVFKKSRGLALGLTLSGTAVASIVIPPLCLWLIKSFGWRESFVWLGVGWGGLTLLLCFFLFFDAHDQAAKRQKANPATAAETAPEGVQLEGLTRRQALFDSALWRVGISNFVVMAMTQGLAIHLFLILTEAGVSEYRAAFLSSLSGFAGIAGKLVTGVLLDQYRPNWIGGVTLGAAALSFLFLIDGMNSPVAIVIAMLVNGYAAGTKTQITGFLTASYGGMRNFGLIYGVMAALMALAAAGGPLLAGRIYDLYGNYGPFLMAGTIGCALGGLLMISMPSYPAWARKPAKAEAKTPLP